MKIKFCGADQSVTGSQHLISANGKKILLDCGLMQGKRKEAFEINRNLPFDPSTVDAMLLSHAHLDHSGNIPHLVKSGFKGHIYTTSATLALCQLMLRDSAFLQEKDVMFVNKKRVRQHKNPFEPLYTINDVEKAMLNFIGVQYDKKIEIFPGISATFIDAGHILGSAGILLEINENGKEILHSVQNDRNEGQNERNESQNERNENQNDRNESQNDRNENQNDRNEGQNDRNEGQNDRNEGQNDRNEGKTIRLGFSGDVGRPEMPILRDPIPLPNLDALIIESTYGNRFHPANDHVQEETLSVINKVIKRGGKIIIPAFAVGRTQLLVYELHELFDQKKLPVFPIFVDSPLAVNVTEVYRLHPECFDRETYNEFLNIHEDPFGFSRLTYTRDVNESKKLNTFKGPCMIISASGMAEGGRILHHLANNIEDANNLILFAGYAAKETLARKIMDGAESINIFGDPYTVRAEIKKMDYFSAHADQPGLLKYVDASKPGVLNNIFIVHGEPEESLPLQEKIKGMGYKNVHYPKTGEEFEI